MSSQAGRGADQTTQGRTEVRKMGKLKYEIMKSKLLSSTCGGGIYSMGAVDTCCQLKH